MKGGWRKIKIRFLLHELWVVNSALALPLFSLFPTMTLVIWGFIPALAILPFIQFLLEGGFSIDDIEGVSKILFIFIWGIALTLMMIMSLLLFIWWGRWYLICLGLMTGSETRAHLKLAKTQAKLKALTDA